MNKIYIIGGFTVVLIGVLLGYALYSFNSNDYKVSTEPEIKLPVTSVGEPTKVITQESCSNDAEAEYRAYVTSQKPHVDSYGNIAYDLPQSDWDRINAKRAKQIDVCVHTYN